MTLSMDLLVRGDEPGRDPHPLARRSPWMIAEQGFRAGARTCMHFVGSVTGRHGARFGEFQDPDAPRSRCLTAHAAVDEFMLLYFSFSSRGLSADDFAEVETEVSQLDRSLEAAGVHSSPRLLHPDPPVPDPVSVGRSRFKGFDGEWIAFDSAWQPGLDLRSLADWQSDEQNQVVHAGLLRHADGPRPWLVMLHGAEMGRPNLDARLLKARRVHEILGVNVVMPVLPMHGPRRAEVPTVRGSFPSLDLVGNVYGVTQAVWDVRRTIAWVRQQDPTSLGLFGFSLGGLVGGVVAGLESDLDAVVLGCPAVDLTDLIAANLPFLTRSNARVNELLEQAHKVQWVASPLAFEPGLSADRLALISAYADRMSDPVDQVGRLWEHWGRPEIRLTDTGHVTYFMNSEGTDKMIELLALRGIGADRRG